MRTTRKKAAPGGRPVQAKRLNLFATPLAVCILPESEALKAPLAALARDAAADGDGGFADAENAPPELACVIEAAVTLADAMEAGTAGAWALSWRGEILQPGAGSDVESLPDALWCAHYLIDAGGGGGGTLELQDPRGAATVMYAPGLTFAAEGAETLGVSQSIGLKEGALAVFPAWLLQSVALHRGPKPRLSLTVGLRRRTEAA